MILNTGFGNVASGWTVMVWLYVVFPLQPEATEWVAGKESPHFTNNWYVNKELSPELWDSNCNPNGRAD